MVSRVQGNSVRRTKIRGQRVERRHRVSKNKMWEGDNRVHGHVIKEEMFTGTLKGESDHSWAICRERNHEKRHCPGFMSIAPTA